MNATERIAYTVSEIAAMLGVTNKTVYNLVSDGLLKKVNLSSGKKPHIRILKSDLDNYLQGCKEVK